MNFIAQRPQNNARCILIALYHGLNCKLCPSHTAVSADQICAGSGQFGIKIFAEIIVIAVFSIQPTIECLFNDQQSQLITYTDKILIRRIMACANRVYTHILHVLELPIHRICICGRTQCTLVMMQAHTIEFYILSIEMKTLRIKGIITETEGSFFTVDNRVILLDFCLYRIQIWTIHRPQLRIRYRCRQRNFAVAACSKRCTALRIVRNLVAVAVINSSSHSNVCLLCAVILYSRFHGYCSLSILNIRRCNRNTVMGNMHRICHFQCDISINSRTGIPSAGRDIIYRLYCNHIFRLAVAGKIFANIHRKRCISIMMLTNLCTIYIDRSIRIYTVEVQHNCFPVVCCRHRKGFAIPARAAG